MAINFIKNIIDNTVDEHTHSKFTRFGKGTYEKEEVIFKITGKNVAIQTGPEFASVFFKLLSEFVDQDVTVKGKMVAKKGQEKRFEDAGIELKATRATTYTIEHTFSADEFKKFVEDFNDFLFLLTATSGANSIKVKPKVPKPGNIIEKFATAKFDKKHLDRLKEEFCFDVNEDAKQYNFQHTYEITETIVDEDLVNSDPLKARLEAKRKGTLKRKITVNGNEEIKEFPMEV